MVPRLSPQDHEFDDNINGLLNLFHNMNLSTYFANMLRDVAKGVQDVEF